MWGKWRRVRLPLAGGTDAGSAVRTSSGGHCGNTRGVTLHIFLSERTRAGQEATPLGRDHTDALRTRNPMCSGHRLFFRRTHNPMWRRGSYIGLPVTPKTPNLPGYNGLRVGPTRQDRQRSLRVAVRPDLPPGASSCCRTRRRLSAAAADRTTVAVMSVERGSAWGSGSTRRRGRCRRRLPTARCLGLSGVSRWPICATAGCSAGRT
jgi:hypothetical protein